MSSLCNFFQIDKTVEATSDALGEMHRQWNIEMMRMANNEVDGLSGQASCNSIKNSSEDLEMYYIAVCSIKWIWIVTSCQF